MTGLRAWLDEMGLPHYAESFERNAIDESLLPGLTDADLIVLGVAALGHRKRLLAAIAALRDTVSPTASPEAKRPSPPSTPAERRQLTVLFCDLSGSTQLSQELDPESLRTLLESYQRACRAVVERYEGHVAQYLGDGIMAYFGWPRAHEDDAERALRAALELASAVKSVEAPAPLRVRIGVASGPVVVGEGGDDPSSPKLAVGETPNMAARLQGLAGLDEIVIAPSTRQLAGGVFRYADLGPRTLKGILEPVRAWRVEGLSEAQGRFEARTGHLTPLVGRQDEVELLEKRWAQASSGEGQVVLLSGEPGIGKSRLTQVLSEHVAGGPHYRLRYQCSPYHVNSAFYPIVEHLTRAARLSPEDSAQSKLAKLEASLAQSNSTYPHSTQLIAALLGIPTDYPPLNYTPQKHKDETVKALAAQVTGLAAQAPVLLVLEDAHWIDPSSLEAFEQLIQAIPSQRILLLVTYRPEFQPSWVGQSYVTLLALSRLDRRQTSQLASRVAEGNRIPEGLLEQIQARTDGIPLFIEELTKVVLEACMPFDDSSAAPPGTRAGTLAIPATLRDSLMARLDRIGAAREVAQLASCIGREFDYRLLEAVAQLDRATLDASLDRLLAAELVFQRGKRPDASFQFKHALVQDAAYDSLLKSARVRLHARIAETLEQDFPQLPETSPELLARHFSAAESPLSAIRYWTAAGHRARTRGALPEAIGHLEQGLRDFAKAGPSPERDRLELALHTELGTVWQLYGGWAHPKVAEYLEPASELAAKLGRIDEGAFRIAAGLNIYRLCRGEIRASLASDLEAVAARVGDDSLRVSAMCMTAVTQYYLGAYKAVVALADAVTHGYVQSHDSGLRVLGLDSSVHAGAFRANALWALGYPDQARAQAHRAMAHAAAIDDPYTRAWCHVHCGYVCVDTGDLAAYRVHLDEAERIAREQGMSFVADIWVPSTRLWQLCMEERWRDLVDAFGPVRERYIQSGQLIGLAWHSVSVATGLVALGEAAQALDLLEEALAQILRPGWEERRQLADVLRVQGLAYGALNQAQAAQAAFRAAMDVAREQEAKSFELRAATDYARFLHQRRRTDEARGQLQPVYEWFTEGFDTRDLIEAKVLLDELGR